MSNKLILIDIDGTVLDWKNGFVQFMAPEGIIEKDTNPLCMEWMQGLDGLTVTEEKGRFMVEYFNRLDKIPDPQEIVLKL